MLFHSARFRSRQLSLFLTLLVLAAVPALARPRTILDDAEFRAEAQRGLDRLYDMDFNGADAVFAGISKRYPDLPVGPFLEALSPWWQIQVNLYDESRDDAFLKAMDTVLDRCERRLKKDREDLDGMFFEAGAHALRGRLYADRERYFKAARDGQKALHYLEEVRKRDPQNPDLLLGAGLFDYLVDVVPKQHPFLRVFTSFFPQGSRERGLAELSQAAEKGQFVSTEAAFSLLQIYFVFEDDYATSLHYARLPRRRGRAGPLPPLPRRRAPRAVRRGAGPSATAGARAATGPGGERLQDPGAPLPGHGPRRPRPARRGSPFLQDGAVRQGAG